LEWIRHVERMDHGEIVKKISERKQGRRGGEGGGE
jgi:hypothetical protein